MRRREMLALFAGALASLPPAAGAQTAERIRTVGVLMGLTEDDPETAGRIATFGRAARPRLGRWT
jgi:hypothetical protein